MVLFSRYFVYLQTIFISLLYCNYAQSPVKMWPGCLSTKEDLLQLHANIGAFTNRWKIDHFNSFVAKCSMTNICRCLLFALDGYGLYVFDSILSHAAWCHWIYLTWHGNLSISSLAKLATILNFFFFSKY